MANSILTPTWVGREVLRVVKNSLRFVSNIQKKLSDDFKVEGVDVGATVNVRLPQRWLTTKGQAFQGQPITDAIVPVTITDQANIGFGWSSFSATLEIQDVRERYVNPAAIQIANTIDSDGLTRLYQDVFMTEGTPGTIPSANLTYLNAGARMNTFAAPMPRTMLIGPLMQPPIANANLASFNPQGAISDIWREGQIAGEALSWSQWFVDQNIATHTVGPLGGTPTVNGAGQTGSSIVTQAWTAAAAQRLAKGDIITFAGVFAVNPQNYRSTTQLQQFVVTADVSSDGAGAATIPIYPPIITSGAYQTVTASPANAAAITVVGAANTVTPQGLGFHKEAFVMASADLVEPNVGKASRVRMPDVGLSLRYWQASDIMTDQHPSRLDVIYGFKTLRPEFAIRIAS